MAELTDTAELLTCELVTNAVRHSDGPAQLRIRHLCENRLRVSIWDTNPTIPAPFDAPPRPLDRFTALTEAAASLDATSPGPAHRPAVRRQLGRLPPGRRPLRHQRQAALVR
ncbi:ATP-binding protein, partial [Streptomyces asiaticus]|uniref:ATP-binding protein n=1 Tax=Streptomyces asiaticus TaxID=114695 RepID=UPI0037FC2909